MKGKTMIDYSEYTLEELENMKEEQREIIAMREVGNDFYYSSGQYDSDSKKIQDIDFEIYFRKTFVENDINKLKDLCFLCKLKKLHNYEEMCNEKIKTLE